ncbi:hypothetical protein NBO_83g0006 [Nosema bombycis CQ1]|uniref:Uncharacterized protein n=1 Tax=Nosema bombycis (strain CQ1 / CVCC 102059) TaxID=578461 RepID=R0KSV0_NOSB1|nr:hypothetical protein NBO_83g0006 [Nosema bombycis CQ1]|eukprot:EOB13302.1 hypothetical protein NBO_83g0006 [Nosema bombycis CQ1]
MLVCIALRMHPVFLLKTINFFVRHLELDLLWTLLEPNLFESRACRCLLYVILLVITKFITLCQFCFLGWRDKLKIINVI